MLQQRIELCAHICDCPSVLMFFHTPPQYYSPWCGTARSGDTLPCGHPSHHRGVRCPRSCGSSQYSVHRGSEGSLETTEETVSQKEKWLCATVRRWSKMASCHAFLNTIAHALITQEYCVYQIRIWIVESHISVACMDYLMMAHHGTVKCPLSFYQMVLVQHIVRNTCICMHTVPT